VRRDATPPWVSTPTGRRRWFAWYPVTTLDYQRVWLETVIWEWKWWYVDVWYRVDTYQIIPPASEES
jgi:hypothetical protein